MRASDVVVGIIAGAVCAVLSAAYEGGILAFRFFSIDHLGGHFGNEFAVFALSGAAIGGLVAFGAGTLFRRERGDPVNEHQAALQQQYDAALAELAKSAESTRQVIDGDIQALHELGQTAGRPPLIADVPVDEPPPYIPPPLAPSVHALIPDTPLLDSPGSPAFDDDAPLWQS